ncbi:MAG: TonB terminal [Acidobacteria bacterium]|jgi:TonB family protein|nr:TonB terminal [Acidobacteriota bacterium]
MSHSRSGTMLDIPLVKEQYGHPLLASLFVHAAAFLILIFGGFFLPSATIRIGSGAGGGTGGEVTTVGVVDNLSGGTGMIKPSLVPKPPALVEETPANRTKAVPLPLTPEPKKKAAKTEAKTAAVIPAKSNVIPVAPEPGSGGVGGMSGGSGGGVGGGSGISIGSGTGGFGDSWYARAVEARISANWIRPPEGARIEIIYSFFIAGDGTVNGIKQEKSSGNAELDLTAARAIRALQVDPLPPPPQEFRGRRIQFIAQFVYPPNP